MNRVVGGVTNHFPLIVALALANLIGPATVSLWYFTMHF